MKRQERISKGKVWHVYKDGRKTILHETTSRSKALGFISKKFGLKNFKNGKIRIAKVIYEPTKK